MLQQHNPTQNKVICIHTHNSRWCRIEIFLFRWVYQIIDGPEAESEEYNFSGYHIPREPPCSWYVWYLLAWRTRHAYAHTHITGPSHAMRNKPLPLAVVAPGKCYRHEATDASHEVIFMQCEGLLIDKNISMANLLATTQTFLKALFKNNELDIRIRPGFFHSLNQA